MKPFESDLKSGFTLIEVLVFVTIMSIILIAAVALTATSINQLKTQQYKILATHFAESLFEWLEAQKELDWQDFVSKATQNGKVYCFNDLNISDWPGTSGSCSDYSLGANEMFNGKQIFKREVKLTKIGEDVKAAVTVTWKDTLSATQVRSLTLEKTFPFVKR